MCRALTSTFALSEHIGPLVINCALIQVEGSLVESPLVLLRPDAFAIEGAPPLSPTDCAEDPDPYAPRIYVDDEEYQSRRSTTITPDAAAPQPAH